MSEQQTTTPNTLPKKNRKRVGALMLTGATAFGLGACSDADPGSAVETTRPTVATSTKSSGETTTNHEVLVENAEKINAGTALMIEAATYGADEATMQNNVAMWGNDTVAFRAEFDEKGALQVLSGGPVDEYAEQTQGFQLEFYLAKPCQSDHLPFCLNQLSQDDMISGIASFVDGGSSANVYIKKDGNNLSYQVTDEQGNSNDPERAAWLWDDISKKLHKSAMNDISDTSAAQQPVVEEATPAASIETTNPSPETQQAPESIDAQIDGYVKDAVTSVLESFNNVTPRQIDPNTITNFPEDQTSFEPGKTFALARDLPDTQQLSLNIRYEDGDSIVSVLSTFTLTRKNQALLLDEMNLQKVNDALAGFRAENEQTIYLENMIVEETLLEKGEQRAVTTININRLYDNPRQYYTELNIDPNPTSGSAGAENGITDIGRIQSALQETAVF